MSKTFLEDVFYAIYGEDADSEESKFYWDTLMTAVEQYADPKYDRNSLSNHFYYIACGLSHAEVMRGFQRGITFAMRMMADTLYTPERTRNAAEEAYKRFLQPVELAEARPCPQVPSPAMDRQQLQQHLDKRLRSLPTEKLEVFVSVLQAMVTNKNGAPVESICSTDAE